MASERTETSLDNPIWNSLTTRHVSYSKGGDLARRFHPEIGPLAGMRDQSPEAYEALGKLLAPGEFGVLFLDAAPKIPAGWQLQLHRSGDQMICNEVVAAPARDLRIEPLTNADVPEMLELTKLTNPGPFRTRTIELGGFIGIREGGRLAAMAGQRLALQGFIEVSGVCTHPDFRGRGYAQALVAAIVGSIRERGETPILHVYSSNISAIRVYESLGFTLRRTLEIAVVAPPAMPS